MRGVFSVRVLSAVAVGWGLMSSGCGAKGLTPVQQDEIENDLEYIHPGTPDTAVKTDQGDLIYSFTYTPTPLAEGPITFTLTIKRAADGTPVTGAAVEGQVWGPDGQDVMAQTNEKELGNGAYKIEDIVFDRPGNWLVKFHTQIGDPDHGGLHNHAKFAFIVP